MTEKEIIDYWTHKINVEIPAKFEAHRLQKEKEIIEHNKKSLWKMTLSIANIIPAEIYKEMSIPVCVYEVLQKNNVKLTGIWNCASGRKAYDDIRKLTFFVDGVPVGDGTPINGYYRIIEVQDNGFVCYYNSSNAKEFVSQEIWIKAYQLFAPDSEGKRTIIKIGDILHVESIQLINNRYAIKWRVL